MRHLVCTLFASAILLGAASAQDAPQGACAYDTAAMMNLDVDTFNSTPGQGWRTIGDTPGCEGAAADLLALYRTQKIDEQRYGLMHHEAQMRAAAGQYPAAIALIEEVRAGETETDMVAYRDAELAFLRGDRPALLEARERLANLPKPDWFEDSVANFRQRYPDSPPPTWPVNLETVDALVRCFGQPYRDAYGCRDERANPP